MEAIIKTILEKSLKDKDLNKILSKLTEEEQINFIRRNIGDISLYFNQSKCASCESLDKCLNSNPGYQLKLQNKDDKCCFDFKMCEKRKKKVDHQKMITKKISINDFTKNEDSLNLINIEEKDLTPETKAVKILIKLLQKQSKDPKSIYSYYISSRETLFKRKLFISFTNELIRKNKDYVVAFIKITNVSKLIKESFDNYSKKTKLNSIIDRAMHSNLLIIDGIDAESFKSWLHMNFLYEIIEYRNCNNLPIIYLANHELDKLKKYFIKSGEAHIVNNFMELLEETLKMKTQKNKKFRIYSLN